MHALLVGRFAKVLSSWFALPPLAGTDCGRWLRPTPDNAGTATAADYQYHGRRSARLWRCLCVGSRQRPSLGALQLARNGQAQKCLAGAVAMRMLVRLGISARTAGPIA
jgi:hypothetical protein